MNAANRCPECGTELAANAPQGLCPACLLKRGLETRTAVTGESQSSGLGDFVPPTPEELAARFPDLEILEVLGRGGMGVVYKARQKHLDRLVAMKLLSPKIAEDPAFAERFAREARAMALLSHPNIVAVYDFGQKDGLFYFLMELVDGLSLRQLLDAGKLSPQEALAIVPQICDALQYAHNKGVVHRDIKPENILMDRAGQVKIADFGLAKLLGQPVKDVSLTGTGQVMGTLHYMAPEQMEQPQKVDHRADIYSLGVVFYQLLTGELPIGRFAPPSKKVAIDVRLDDVVLRALERDPELRYQHVSDVKTQMDSIAATPGSALPSIGVGQPACPSNSRLPSGPLPEAKLSRTAIVGAAWAPFFFIVAVLSLMVFEVHTGGKPPETTWWQWVLRFTVLPVGGLAPFVTTILGMISISQIRHSMGRLYGLGLALADAMLFPLLALDALIWVFFWAFTSSSGKPGSGSLLVAFTPLADFIPGRIAIGPIAVLVALVVDFLLVRWVWRALNASTSGPASPSANGGQSPHNTQTSGSQVIARPLPDAKLSRTAVVGVVCAPLFFVAVLLSLVVVQVDSRSAVPPNPHPTWTSQDSHEEVYRKIAGMPPPPAWWQWVLMFTVLPVGLLAPFETTILGLVALTQIRHSAGRLYGLGLALADAMLFPLLTLDVLIGIPVHAMVGEFPLAYSVAFEALAFLVTLVVDFLLVRWAWRAMNAPVAMTSAG